MSKKQDVERRPWGFAEPHKGKVAPVVEQEPLKYIHPHEASCLFYSWCNSVSRCWEISSLVKNQGALLVNDFLTTPGILNLSEEQLAAQSQKLLKIWVARTVPEAVDPNSEEAKAARGPAPFPHYKNRPLRPDYVIDGRE